MFSQVAQERRDMPGELESPAAVARTIVEFPILVEAFTGMAERALSSGDFSGIASSELERVITAAVKLYAAKAEVEETLAEPISAERATPTEVVIVVSEMLHRLAKVTDAVRELLGADDQEQHDREDHQVPWRERAFEHVTIVPRPRRRILPG